jgi:hypothetical protein
MEIYKHLRKVYWYGAFNQHIMLMVESLDRDEDVLMYEFLSITSDLKLNVK